jgi:hypothetical protein
MAHRLTLSVVLVGAIVLSMNAKAAAQVTGTGTPGTVPLWTGDGTMLTDSHVQDDGSNVTVLLPVQVSGTVSGIGSNSDQPGIDGFNSSGDGVRGTSSNPFFAGISGINTYPNPSGGLAVGVRGHTASPTGMGVYGEAFGASSLARGVVGLSQTGSGVQGVTEGDGPNVAGVLAFSGGSAPGLLVQTAGSAPYAGVIEGDFLVTGNAFKPGGGWSDLSDEEKR